MQVSDLQSDALFILLVEKDAAFMRLAEDRFYNTYPCIILTAKGQPDVASRCTSEGALLPALLINRREDTDLAGVKGARVDCGEQVVSAEAEGHPPDPSAGAGGLGSLWTEDPLCVHER